MDFLITSSAIILIFAFAGMVTSSYTADHIKRSSCSIKSDAHISTAYQWAWTTAVLTGLLAGGAGVALGYYLIKKYK